ncbi:MAG: YbjN domain-containing protein, partial [Mycobacteriales bacterium]
MTVPGSPAGEVEQSREQLDRVLRGVLDEAELPYETSEPGAYLVRLAGEHKLATMCWLVVGDHSLLVEAFVVR